MTRAEFECSVQSFISKEETIARGMTDVDVGSGALFGDWDRSKTLAITRLNGSRVYQARNYRRSSDSEAGPFLSSRMQGLIAEDVRHRMLIFRDESVY